jgi:rubrerythrin
MAKDIQDNIADFLNCASILEERTYMLYKSLADKVDLPLVNSLLLHIAYDSQKHSAILRGISASVAKSKKQLIDCGKKSLGETWTTIERLAAEISKEEKLTKEQMSSLVKKLMILESTVGEEYYILVQLKTLQFMTKEIRELYNVDLEDLKDILETIIRDEETHRELLSKMKKILSGEEKKSEDTVMTVKYKNPDAWSRAMPDSVYEDARR